MFTTPGPLRLYRRSGPDHVAVVSVEPATGPTGGSLIRLARGAGGKAKLARGSVFGPFDDKALAVRYAEIVAALRAEGFETPGLPALLDALNAPEASRRARAALRLGWRRETEAVGPILESMPRAIDEACSYLDALGAIGDPRAIPALRDYAARKLLSRRRSAVEALRALGDAEGLAVAITRALEQLPPSVRQAVEAQCDPSAIAQAVLEVDAQFRGLALDLLYEIGTPALRDAVLAALDGLEIDQPYVWRYIKSIYKRSMLRHDAETFGRLARWIEVRARNSKGTEALLKSGHDGVQRVTSVFRHRTQTYLRRLGWRYLSNLARHRSALYPHAAAEAIAAHAPGDPEEPNGLRGAFARCHLWHRVLRGRSHRFVLDSRRLVFRFRDAKSTKASPDLREESWPELWDAQPTAYLRILASARLPEAHEFACRAIKARHPRLLEAARIEQVLPMLRAPYPETVALGLDELQRRFDPARPDLVLLDRVLASDVPEARELGRRWLRESSARWTLDQEWMLVFLAFPDAETAALAAELAASALRDAPAMRRALAVRLLARLRAPEPSPGAHDVYARVAAEALAVETSALLSIPELLSFCQGGSPALQALAGRLLASRPEAGAHLGLEGLLALANHEVASVRDAGLALIQEDLDSFRRDPAPLFLLVESEWPGTRAMAFDILRHHIGYEGLGFEGLVGLLDSNRPDVRDAGRLMAREHADRIALKELARRMSEHPEPDMRRFALDLIVSHLPDGAEALSGVAWFLRSALLALQPHRLLKRRVIDFLFARGCRDLHQAEVAARLLAETARMAVRSDADHALESLARLGLAWPGLKLPEGIAIAAGGVA